jgi:ABC-2 type transport system permease protein
MMTALIRKEIKEMLNKSTIIYVVVISVLFAFIGNFLSQTQQDITEAVTEGTTVIAVANQDAGPYAATLVSALDAGADVVYDGPSYDDARQALDAQGGVALITIPHDFSRSIESGQQASVDVLWIMEGSGLTDSLPGSVIDSLLSAGEQAISAQLIAENSGLQPALVLNPATSNNTTEFRGKLVEGVTPSDISNLLTTRTLVIPIAVMMLIIMGATSVISSMGMEKENRTLETLLTLPVSRSSIIVSKIVGSAVAGLAMGAIYMVGFYTYFTSLGSSSLNMAALGLALNAGDYALIGLSIFASLMAALCMAIILGTFASNYRAAQTLTFPIIGMAMIPMMLTLFMDFDTMSTGLKVLTFIIPFSHPMMAMKALMLDNYPLVISGIAYNLAFTALMVAITVRIFSTDRVITGTMPMRFKLGFKRG